MRLFLLLWTLVLSSSRARGQSGDGYTDLEPSLSCTSHISLHEGTNITCRLVSRSSELEDDEDGDEEDTIEQIKACCCELGSKGRKCVEEFGDTVSSQDLNPVSLITVSALSKRGLRIEKTLDVKKIIKPKSPEVFNVSLNQDQALVHVQIPYHKDYLKEENLRFQLQLSDGTFQAQNMTSRTMNIGLSHLHSGTQYHVKVRAIPWDYFQGSWSEWSPPYTFTTPPRTQATPLISGETPEKFNFMLWSIVLVVVVVVIVLFLWKNRGILTYMWPSIPHPKTTLGQICGPNNGLLLFYIPEEFSSLNVYTVVSQSEAPSCKGEEPALSCSSGIGTTSSPSSSNQSTDASTSSSSVWTEELELLSQSSTTEDEDKSEGLSTEEDQDKSEGVSTEEEDQDRSEGLSTEEDQDRSEGLSTEEEDQDRSEGLSTEDEQDRDDGLSTAKTGKIESDDSYVTMSSFYQNKTADQADPAENTVA